MVIIQYKLMEPARRKAETVIWCSNCRKNIKVNNYRIHVWFCSGTQKINPVLANMFKSQLHMSKKLHQLLKQQQHTEQELFPCVHCSHPMRLEDFDTHPAKCPSLPIECPYCHIQFPKDLMDEHENYCQEKKNKSKHPLQKAKSFPLPTPSPKSLDQPTIDQHVQFLMRQLAHNMGVMKSKALTNKDLINLHKSCYKGCNTTSQEDVCPICDINFQQGQNLVKLPCKHQYHRRCICAWFSIANTCPMCRYQLQKKK